MAIYGRNRRTILGFNGVLGKPEGFESLHFMINLDLSLQIAGSFTGDFCDLPIIPPSQIAQQGDGDIRLVVTVTDGNTGAFIPVDISAATTKVILLRKPDLTAQALFATLMTNGRDGKMYIALGPSDLDQAGFYFVQGTVVIASVAKSTVLGHFKVAENITPTPED